MKSETIRLQEYLKEFAKEFHKKFPNFYVVDVSIINKN